jgi:ribose 5-phosphate isomerase B
MKVAIGSDHGGYLLKETVKEQLQSLGLEVKDFGCHSEASVDYPDYALQVAQAVADGQFDRGILICGTGIGMCITANKVKGVRCALVHDCFSAKAAREHNDSNVLAMGARVIGSGLASEIVKIWLDTPFEGGRHERRLSKITQIEQNMTAE